MPSRAKLVDQHKMADSNGDGGLSYVEYANAIYRSPKHGPVGFMKSDRDKSGTLNVKEFAGKLNDGIKWWKCPVKRPPNGTRMPMLIPMGCSANRNS